MAKKRPTKENSSLDRTAVVQVKGDFTSSDSYKKYLPFALAALFVIFYFPLLSGTRYLWEDVLKQQYPNIKYTVSCLKSGIIPYWTQNVFGGMPHLADPQTTIYYPPTWIIVFFSLFTTVGGTSYIIYILLHVLIMGYGTYRLGIDFKFKREAAFFTAVATMFAGFVSTHVIHTIFLYVAAWFPFIFLFLRKAYREGDIKLLLIASLFSGVSILGGYPQYSLHIMYFLAFWTLFDIILKFKINRSAAVKTGVMFTLFSILTLAFASIQYLPSFEIMAVSLRNIMTYEKSIEGSIEPSGFLTLYAPKLFGFISGDTKFSTQYWGARGSYFFWETTLFVGISSLLLAVRAFISFKERKDVLFFGIVAFVLALLAVGDNTPLYKLVFNFAPGFKTFRFPSRFGYILTFSLIMLAGTGVDLLLKKDEEKEKKFIKGAAIFAAVLLLSSFLFLGGVGRGLSESLKNEAILESSHSAVIVSIIFLLINSFLIFKTVKAERRKKFVLALSLLLFVELYAFGHTFAYGTRTPDQFYGESSKYEPIRKLLDKGFFRIQGRLFHGPGKGQMMFPRNLGNVENIPLVEGYNQLRLKRYNTFIEEINPEKAQKLFNIRFKKLADKGLSYPLPTTGRFYLSSDFTVKESEKEVVGFINDSNFIMGKSVVLERPPATLISSKEEIRGSAQVLEENSNYIKLKVDSDKKSLLCISEVYFPAWKGSVNGVDADIIPSNLLFRAIEVPAGSSEVVMTFNPPAVFRGRVVCFSALLLTLILIFGQRFLTKKIYRIFEFNSIKKF